MPDIFDSLFTWRPHRPRVVDRNLIPDEDPFEPFRIAADEVWQTPRLEEVLAEILGYPRISSNHRSRSRGRCCEVEIPERQMTSQSHQFIKKVARMPTPDDSSEADIPIDLSQLKDRLGSHQVAAIGRLLMMLKTHSAAILAHDTRPGRYMIIVGNFDSVLIPQTAFDVT